MMTSDDLPLLWGDYEFPALAGVRGTIEFAGPEATVYAEIHDGAVRFAPAAEKVDATLRSDEPGLLFDIVTGGHNAVTAVLQGRIQAEGNLLLLLEVAGSMKDLGKQLADRLARRHQGGEAWPANP
jgi:hypothetical protein